MPISDQADLPYHQLVSKVKRFISANAYISEPYEIEIDDNNAGQLIEMVLRYLREDMKQQEASLMYGVISEANDWLKASEGIDLLTNWPDDFEIVKRQTLKRILDYMDAKNADK